MARFEKFKGRIKPANRGSGTVRASHPEASWLSSNASSLPESWRSPFQDACTAAVMASAASLVEEESIWR